MRSARDTMARRTPSARGCPEADRTPAAVSRAAIWVQLAPAERSSRKSGRNSRMTGCIARRPRGPSSEVLNRPACISAVFFVIMQIRLSRRPIGRNRPKQTGTVSDYRSVTPRLDPLQKVSITPVHRWMAPAWRELLRRFSATCKVGMRSSFRPHESGTIVRRALMVVR